MRPFGYLSLSVLMYTWTVAVGLLWWEEVPSAHGEVWLSESPMFASFFVTNTTI